MKRAARTAARANRADIWISTVIYMLIGLSVISGLLIAARPKIEEARDRLTIQSMINNFNVIHSYIKEVNEVPGTARILEIKINKGEMRVLPKEDRIEWSIVTNFEFSEPGLLQQVGNIYLITTKQQKIVTTLFVNYTTPINITTAADGEGQNLTLTQSPSIYKIKIENLGPPQQSENNTIFISML
jgi:hypothetical protein